MKMKIVIAIFMIGLITEGHTQLYCYVCENCPDGNNLSDEYLISCSEEETPTSSQPISTTEQPLTSPPVDATTSSTVPTSTELSTSETSTSPEQPTQPTSETTTVQTTVSNTEPATESSTQNTNPSSIGPTTEQTSIVSTITVPQSPITTTSAVPGTESTLTTDEITTATVPIAIPSTTGRPTETAPPMLSRYSFKQSAYNCFVLVNETHHVNRGCVAASPNPNEMCRKANKNILPAECRVCASDKCNSSSQVVFSVLLLLFSICTALSL